MPTNFCRWTSPNLPLLAAGPVRLGTPGHVAKARAFAPGFGARDSRFLNIFIERLTSGSASVSFVFPNGPGLWREGGSRPKIASPGSAPGESGRIPKWPTGADCKSAGLCLRWFESSSYHHLPTNNFQQITPSISAVYACGVFQPLHFHALSCFSLPFLKDV